MTPSANQSIAEWVSEWNVITYEAQVFGLVDKNVLWLQITMHDLQIEALLEGH